MKRTLILAAPLALLAACSGPSQFIPLGLPNQERAQIQTQSRLSQLRPGMTQRDVSQVAGLALGSVDDPATVGRVCFSHPYGDPARPLFIHAIYLGGHLQSATDGHPEMCSLASF